MRRIIVGAAIVAAAGLAAELPVKEVVLYKNGIGYFVRTGELKAGESARLEFKAEEMNDVLKSLTVFNESGGKVSGLHYDSSEPLEKRLERFPFKLGGAQPISALLDQLRGARIELKTGPETLAGAIVGAREIEGNEKQPPRQEVTLLADSGELRTVDLGGVTAIRFSDPVLQHQLKDYLGTVAAGRSKEKRSLYIDSTDAAGRRLTAAYVIPTPVWKSSYRLVFAEAQEPTLEGWAIVDNTTGEDWRDARLALVSGRPVSFIARLYEPRYVRRQSFDVIEDEAAAPEMHEGGVVGGLMATVPAAPPPPAPMKAPAAMERLDKSSRLRSGAGGGVGSGAYRVEASSIAEAAHAGDVGELFEYRFEKPVTVKDGESAMLPFVQQKIAARKLLIYSMGEAEHPRNAAELTNSTGKTLDGGPVTVFDGNAYAGEAPMETLKSGDKRLISYAVDMGTRVTTRLDSSSDVVREIHVRRGVLTARAALRQTTTYTIRNVDQKPKTLVLEHALRPEFKLIGMKPAETTASAYRFELKLGPAATEKYPVVEERVYDQTYALTSLTPDVLVTFVENRALDDNGRRQLERIVAQKARIAQNDNELKRAGEKIEEIVRDQERLRQNLMSLNQVAGQQDQVQGYARQLAEQEKQLAALRDRQAELRKNQSALQAELDRLIEAMEF